MANVTSLKPPSCPKPDIIGALDQLLAGIAILQCYIDTIPDKRAADRYVLWAAREAIERGYSLLD